MKYFAENIGHGGLAPCSRGIYATVGDEDKTERKIRMAEMTLQSIISAKKEIVTADMDGDTVMMSIEAGKYYNLGKMGGVIWGMIAEPIAVETVILELLEQYEVTRERCEAEVLSFLKQMDEEELLEV